MSRFDYEKNNAITSLKNEKYGIEQLLSDLNNLKYFDYSKVNGKIINATIEKALKSCIEGYLTFSVGYDNINQISIIVKERYNSETKGYISFYDSYKIPMGYNKVLKDGIREQRRFDTFKMLENIDREIEFLTKQLEEINDNLKNIDSYMIELQEIYTKVKNFKVGKSSFFLDCFRDLNGFY